MDFQEFDEIINSFKEQYILNKYCKKNNLIIYKFIQELRNNKELIEKALEDENKYWGRNFKIEKLFRMLDKYANIELGNKEKFGIGNIVAITTGDPYLHLELIIKSILANCKLMVIANPTMINFNLYITNVIRDVLESEKLDKNLISFIDIFDYKSKIVENKNAIDCIIVNQNYEDYDFFIKKVFAKVIYLDYGNINIYTDSAEYEESIEKIVTDTDSIDMDVYDYKIDEFLKKENNNFIFNTAVIYSKDIKKCMQLYEMIKARNIFINTFDINKIDIGLDINDLLFEKNIVVEDGK